MASTPILPLAVWQSGTNQNSIPANDNALRIEALNREIISQAVTAQPASPADGDTYIIAATHTGAQWASFTPKDIAIFKGGTWYAWAPTEGLIVNVAGSEFKYDGGAWVAIGGISGMANPMTASGDIIYGGTPSAGVAPPTRLAATTNGYVLTLTSGLPAWAPASGGFSNPMTTSGDLILGGASGAPGRLAIGANGTVLTVTAGVVGWQAAASGFANPMTTAGDIITGGASGSPQRLAAGSTGYVLTIVAGAPAWAAASGGGLSGYTASLNTASPNATINTSQLLASGGSTDQDAAITPKGAGALLAQVPDSTAAGGNKRGNYAVDLQLLRALATQVSSANYSTISGGQSNRASSTYTAIGGGLLNVASQSYAVVAGGWANTASGLYAGVTNGRDNVANGQQSRVGGSGGTARGIAGADIYGIVGGNQRGAYGLQRYTTNATQAVSTVDFNATPDATNQIVLADNMAVTFSGYVVAKQSGSLNAKHWKFEGGIVRGSGAGTTALTAAVTASVISAAAGASAWAVDIDADTTLGCLRIKVTGAAATNIAWTVVVEPTAEVVLA